jgi:hypothetical protein
VRGRRVVLGHWAELSLDLKILIPLLFLCILAVIWSGLRCVLVRNEISCQTRFDLGACAASGPARRTGFRFVPRYEKLAARRPAVTAMPALLPLALTLASPGAAASERGLWIGSLQLCRETVAAARIVSDPNDGSENTLVLRLRPGAQQLLARETGASVGRPLHIALDGRVLSAPIVREEITGGHAQLSAPAADLRAARRAIRARCRSPRR